MKELKDARVQTAGGVQLAGGTLKEMVEIIEQGMGNYITSRGEIRSKKCTIAHRDSTSILILAHGHVLAFITYSTSVREKDVIGPCGFIHELHVLQRFLGADLWGRGLGCALLRDAELAFRKMTR